MPFTPPTPKILIPKLKKMSDALHEYGTLALLQFWVFGNQYMSSPGNANWGFTTMAAREENQEVCHEMDDAEINEIIESVAANVYVNAGRHLTGFGGKSLAEDFQLLAEMSSLLVMRLDR